MHLFVLDEADSYPVALCFKFANTSKIAGNVLSGGTSSAICAHGMDKIIRLTDSSNCLFLLINNFRILTVFTAVRSLVG